MKTKLEAIISLMKEAQNERGSNSAAKRAVRAAKILGLDQEEIIQLMGWLDYCGADGVPFHSDVERSW